MLRFPSSLVRMLVVLVGACALSACGADNDYGFDVGREPGFDPAARQELLDLGVGKYLGQFTPDKTYTIDNETTFEFAPDPTHMGPICFKGDPFRTTIRDTGSRDLLIYLQGGGACWSALCNANTKSVLGVPPIGWTADGVENNPLRSYNVVFVSYCDGSVFSGDNDFKDPDHGGPDGYRHHHGLANLSAAVDIALEHFPDPDKIVLAGSSAGGYGTLIGTEVTRLAYPHTPLYVINDAGVGLTTKPVFDAVKTEWKFEQFVPASCKACQIGQLTQIIGWALDHDPSMRVGAFSSYRDGIIGGGFLRMDPDKFKALLLEETGKVHEQYPHRFERFLVKGGIHTAILGGYPDKAIDGVSIGDWTRRMIDNRYDWPDLLAKEE